MIRAEITMVDGDVITMPFACWGALALWMSDEAGTYTGVTAAAEDVDDDTLRDDP
ncbi:MAG: hypothetical protein II008_13235 [Oscillospiraceae bacterium]|nr:hypothetical protein [Oscillospiraceae bacterium]